MRWNFVWRRRNMNEDKVGNKHSSRAKRLAHETSTLSPTWSSSKVGVTCTRERGRARVREGQPERNRKESKRAKET